jgi:hypothetical protein
MLARAIALRQGTASGEAPLFYRAKNARRIGICREAFGTTWTVPSAPRTAFSALLSAGEGNPGLGCHPPDVLAMESTSMICSPPGGTPFREIDLTLCTLREKPI